MAGAHERNYDERQVAAILERATELQQQRNADGRTMTLAEIEGIAREAGLDPALVRRAALEIVHVPVRAPSESRLLGGPLALVSDGVVDGAADPAIFERLVALVRASTGEHGSFDVIGGSLSWASNAGPAATGVGRQIHFSVSIAPESTTVRVDEQLAPLAGAIYGALFGGVGSCGMGLVIVPILAFGHPGLVPVGMAAWLGSIYVLARRLYRTRVRRRRHEIDALRRALVAVVEDAVVASDRGDC